MKIAFTYCGHLRTMEYVIPNTLRFIGDLLPNVDFFIHTWEKNESRKIHSGSVGYESLLNEHSPDEIEKKFRSKEVSDTYEVLDKIKTIYGDQIKKIKVDKFDHNNFIGKSLNFHWHSWKESNKLKQEYEQELNFKYDFVIKSRPDFLCKKENSLRAEIDNCLKNKPESSFFVHDDVFYMGYSNIVDNAASFVDVKKERNLFGSYLNETYNIKTRRALVNESIMYRPQAIPVSSLQFKKCKNIDRYWYANKVYWDPYPDNEIDEEN